MSVYQILIFKTILPINLSLLCLTHSTLRVSFVRQLYIIYSMLLGEQLKQIESHVDDTIDYVGGGNKHIQSAIDNRSQRRKYMCYIAIVFVIILVAILAPVISSANAGKRPTLL